MIEITVNAAQALSLSDALLENGALSVDVTDAHAGSDQESPLFREPGESGDPAFRQNRVRATFDEKADPVASLRQSCVMSEIRPVPNHQLTRIEEQDWVRLTQNQFSPIRISTRLWIVPTWHVPPETQAINIILDPGLAFGTGSHPTTRLCLAWLDRHLQPGTRMIDYGCGSGILAIAAMKLGARQAIGIDIDPQAVLTSRENAGQNDVQAVFLEADAPRPEAAELVVANILSNPLIVLAPLLAELTQPGGTIVLSGILVPQSEKVAQVYRRWYEMSPVIEEEGWVLLSGRRRVGGQSP